MQQINTERQRTSARLLRQLPANTIKQKTLPIDQKHLNKNSQSARNRSEKLTEEKREQWPLRRPRTDLEDFDTHRSLSSVPTYSSLSRHSPETRECATQITTLTPTETIEDDREILHDSPLPIDNNHILLVDEIPFEEFELMPIASGFGQYPYNYPTTKTARVGRSPMVSRDPQFRDIQRDKSQNGVDPNSKTKSNGKSRPTAVRQPPPSDTIVSSPKRNEINSNAPKMNLPPNGFRRIPPREPLVNSASSPSEKKRSETMRGNDTIRPAQKYLSSPLDQQDLGRKPIRFANKQDNAYPPPSDPTPRDPLNRPRVMRVANNEYVVRRRKQAPSDHIYDDYHTDDPIERTRPQRVVRVSRDGPYRDDDEDDDYYVERASPRRVPVVRRSSPKEYVYADEPTSPIRHRRARRPEVAYADDDQPGEYGNDYIYVDEDGNEVDFNDKRNASAHYVEYVYDDDNDEKDRRRSHKPKVIYVDDDAPVPKGRNPSKSKQPSSTRIVYE